MAVTVLTFVSGGQVDYRWPDAYAVPADAQLEQEGQGAAYEVSSWAQGTAAALVFEWGANIPERQIESILQLWVSYAARVGLRPGPATVGPQLGSQTASGLAGWRYFIVPGGGGGVGVRT